MRCLIQRVTAAQVDINDETVGKIDRGLLVLVCAMAGDTEDAVRAAAKKCVNLRIFKDDAGKMNRSLLDVEGEALIVSQFTLAAETASGNRPGFSKASPPDEGRRLYELFCRCVSDHGVNVATGAFGADMQVHLVNDGPVTICLDI